GILQVFTASDGARIAYRDSGRGTPIVLLHGLMAHAGFFEGQAGLADIFRIVALDLRGHGASAAAERQPPSVERMAADVAELADWASLQFARNNADAIAAIWASLIRQDVRALLERIQHPTLIVHGGRSELYGDDTAGHLVAALPHARAVRFENSGHAPHLEEPELFNATLTDFADSLSLARTTQNSNS